MTFVQNRGQDARPPFGVSGDAVARHTVRRPLRPHRGIHGSLDRLENSKASGTAASSRTPQSPGALGDAIEIPST